jgi:thioredoxin reductase
VTTGLHDELPDIPGLRARWARDVLHCPYCHGHELLARAIVVVEGTIDELVIDEDDRLRGVQMHDGCVIPRDALFVGPRFVPNSALLARLGCDVDADGWVSVDATGRTRVAGVWAAGMSSTPRTGHHRSRSWLRRRDRPQRRPGRRRRETRRPRPRPRPARDPNHQPPTTNHQPPTTNHQPPTTNHQRN